MFQFASSFIWFPDPVNLSIRKQDLDWGEGEALESCGGGENAFLSLPAFYILLDLISYYFLLKSFAPVFMREPIVFVRVWYQVYAGFSQWVFLLSSWKSSCKSGINSSLNVYQRIQQWSELSLEFSCGKVLNCKSAFKNRYWIIQVFSIFLYHF